MAIILRKELCRICIIDLCNKFMILGRRLGVLSGILIGMKNLRSIIRSKVIWIKIKRKTKEACKIIRKIRKILQAKGIYSIEANHKEIWIKYCIKIIKVRRNMMILLKKKQINLQQIINHIKLNQ